MSFAASVLTLYPDMFPGPLGLSLAGSGLSEGAWSLEAVQIRDFATDKHQSVDDTPAGGGAGMVMRADVLAARDRRGLATRRSAPAPAHEPARHAADPGARARTRGRTRRRHPVRTLRGDRPARRSMREGWRRFPSATSSCRAASLPRSRCSTRSCGSCRASWAMRCRARMKVSRRGCWSTRIIRGRGSSRAWRSRTC